MKVLFLLISGASAILTSSLRCSAKDCESCSFQTGCLWQSMTMSCMEAAACAPVGACVDRISFCSPRAMLAKALQEGRVETQIFSAFDRAWTPQDKASTDKPSFTCQLDECSTSLDPKNLCKVVAGVNLEVRTSTDPKSGSTLYTKYMYLCICGIDWDSGPNHRYCRRRAQSTSYDAFPEPGPGYGVGFFPYGEYGEYGLTRYGFGPAFSPGHVLPPPPPAPHPLPGMDDKPPRLIQFEYDDPSVRPGNASEHLFNSTQNSTSMLPSQGVPSAWPSFDPPHSPASRPDELTLSPTLDDGLNPLPSTPEDLPPQSSSSTPLFPVTSYPVIIPGEDDDDQYPPSEGHSSVPDEDTPASEPAVSTPDDYHRNRTTLASLIPLVEEEYFEDEGTGHITMVVKKNSTKPRKNSTSKGSKGGSGGKTGGGSKQIDKHLDTAPPSSPPTVYVEIVPKPLVNIPPSYYSFQSEDQERLKLLEILVYSFSGALVAIILCGVGCYFCQRRKSAPKPASDTLRVELAPIPFYRPSINDLDPEFSRNSDGTSAPLPELSCDDFDALGRKACEDAWAKLGGLPGKGMSQVVIYYGTPYASVVRPGDSTQSLTEEYRSDVLVDVTLAPDEPPSTASNSSSFNTRAKFRYVLRRDASTSVSQSSRSGSHSTDLSLVSNTACSSSASGTEY